MEYNYKQLEKCIFCGDDSIDTACAPPNYMPLGSGLIFYRYCDNHKERVLKYDDLKDLPPPYLG